MAALRHVRVDPTCIAHNAGTLQRQSDACDVQLALDVSADAYGHGAVLAAQASISAGVNLFVAGDSATRAALESAGITVITRDRLAPGARVVTGELYGLTRDTALRPAMRVSATVVALKTIEAGEGVSYGYTYRAAARTTLALVGIGYADGFDRAASNTAHVLLGGRLCRVAGRVAMNAVMVELGAAGLAVAVVPGDEAVLFGDPLKHEPRAADWASALAITATEATSEFGSRIGHPRITSVVAP